MKRQMLRFKHATCTSELGQKLRTHYTKKVGPRKGPRNVFSDNPRGIRAIPKPTQSQLEEITAAFTESNQRMAHHWSLDLDKLRQYGYF